MGRRGGLHAREGAIDWGDAGREGDAAPARPHRPGDHLEGPTDLQRERESLAKAFVRRFRLERGYDPIAEAPSDAPACEAARPRWSTALAWASEIERVALAMPLQTDEVKAHLRLLAPAPSGAAKLDGAKMFTRMRDGSHTYYRGEVADSDGARAAIERWRAG
jgi:hypothetical protein